MDQQTYVAEAREALAQYDYTRALQAAKLAGLDTQKVSLAYAANRSRRAKKQINYATFCEKQEALMKEFKRMLNSKKLPKTGPHHPLTAAPFVLACY